MPFFIICMDSNYSWFSLCESTMILSCHLLVVSANHLWIILLLFFTFFCAIPIVYSAAYSMLFLITFHSPFNNVFWFLRITRKKYKYFKNIHFRGIIFGTDVIRCSWSIGWFYAEIFRNNDFFLSFLLNAELNGSIIIFYINRIENTEALSDI